MNRPAPPSHLATTRGWTLIETLVVLGAVALLAALAAPSFARIGERRAAESLPADLSASFQSARAGAIHHGQDVTVRRTTPCPDATHPTDWRCGWQTFIDRNHNHRPDPDEPVLARHAPVPGHRIVLEGPDPETVSYTPLGRTEPAAQSLVLTPDHPTPPGTGTRRLCLTHGGTRFKTLEGPGPC
jgi:Tfp pilus assembly protein FimT